MVLIFDLDDTLYDERTYVESGLYAVAYFGEQKFGWPVKSSLLFMIETLDNMGRGAIFDLWLKEYGAFSKGLTTKCINVYRHHSPNLHLFKSATELLPCLKEHPLYIVTDGHKLVQEQKVKSLCLDAHFRHIFITHRYGLQNAKPSTYCFELIKHREKCNWKDMLYVGDNPSKDFVNLNKLKMRTVRVLTGCHRNIQADDGYDAQFTIPDLTHFSALLQSLNH